MAMQNIIKKKMPLCIHGNLSLLFRKGFWTSKDYFEFIVMSFYSWLTKDHQRASLCSRFTTKNYNSTLLQSLTKELSHSRNHNQKGRDMTDRNKQPFSFKICTWHLELLKVRKPPQVTSFEKLASQWWRNPHQYTPLITNCCLWYHR